MNISINYCSGCGKQVTTRRIENRMRKYCSNCDSPIYRNPKPCAGILVVQDNSVLLVQRTNPPAVGSWSVPAGYLERDEPARIAAARELAEETNLHVDSECPNLMTTNFISHPNGTHVLIIIYTVHEEETTGQPKPGSDARAVQYWELDELTTDAALEPGYRGIFRRAIKTEQK